MIGVGDKFPEFELTGVSGNIVTYMKIGKTQTMTLLR